MASARHVALMFRLELEDDVARLTLDRPEARNAIPAAGWVELANAVAQVAASGSRLLVVTGAGRSFCAGADLADFPAMQGDAAAAGRFREEMRAALDAVRDLAIPTIARIEGYCYGAGVALAMACDLRLAHPRAQFAITPAKLGISYPQEDVRRLVELIGPGQAARILFSATPLLAGEAKDIGLVDADLAHETALIAAILANDQASLAMLKQAIRRATAGARSDPEMAAGFDALLAGETLARRLEALRRK
jgi:enoyl-CoA hydratase/carnithine racemase